MKIVFLIGCGAVGRSLGRALVGSGRYAIAGVHDVDPARAAVARAELGAEASSGALPRSAALAELVIAAVPGGALAGIAESEARLTACAGGQIWLHTDGRSPVFALDALRGRVRGVGVLHPARVFPPGRVTALPKGCAFAVSGDAEAVRAAEELAQDLGGVPVRIDDASRAAYHAAAVMASNCAVALMSEAREVLVGSCGLSPRDAALLVAGLASSAVDAAKELGLEASLSGPIRRGDAETVRRHLEALAPSPRALDVYRSLGRAVLEVARRTPGYPRGAAEEIARALKRSDDH